ncbi:MAG: hypothetical protein IID49_05770, partial [Proteobacteria bacterium]|nr:hypothetical protein [Pseudomonadota bacterium]
VFLDLLELDANLVAKLLLGHAHHPTALANPLSNVNIYWMLHFLFFPISPVAHRL